MKCKICATESLKLLYTIRDHEIWLCSSCDFGQVWPNETTLIDFYDEGYFSGEKAHYSQAQRQPIRPAVAYWLEHHLKTLNPDAAILEVGPGPGAAAGRYLRQNHPDQKYEAIEISKFASDCLAQENLKVHTGTVANHEIRQACQGKFDFIFGTEVIEHDPDPRAFAKSVFEMLKPGGQCAFSTGNLNGLIAKSKKKAWYYLDPPAHVSYFTPKSAKRLFTSVGFPTVNTWKVGFNYIDLKMKYRIPGTLLVPHLLSIPTGMTINAIRG